MLIYKSSGAGSAFWGAQAKSLVEEEIAHMPKEFRTSENPCRKDLRNVVLQNLDPREAAVSAGRRNGTKDPTVCGEGSGNLDRQP